MHQGHIDDPVVRALVSKLGIDDAPLDDEAPGEYDPDAANLAGIDIGQGSRGDVVSQHDTLTSSLCDALGIWTPKPTRYL